MCSVGVCVLFNLSAVILLAGSDLFSPLLFSIQWPVIILPEEFPLYVPLSSCLQPATAGDLINKLLKTTDWSGSF